MKEITIDQLTQGAAVFVAAAQCEKVVVTQDGKPMAILVGIENKDQEDLVLENSPAFWRMIGERRREPTIPLSAVKAELLAGD